MDLTGCRHWVFDMDGTLTVAVHDFDAMRAELELPGDSSILEELQRLPPAEAAWRWARLDEIEVELAGASRPAVGASALLAHLTGRGARLGIFTRNTLANARITLAAAGLAEFFDEADIRGRDLEPAKPDPAGLVALLDAWGAAPEEAVVVGDYRYDLEVGRAAGVPTVHVDPSGAFGWPELTDRCVRRLDELLPGTGIEA